MYEIKKRNSNGINNINNINHILISKQNIIQMDYKLAKYTHKLQNLKKYYFYCNTLQQIIPEKYSKLIKIINSDFPNITKSTTEEYQKNVIQAINLTDDYHVKSILITGSPYVVFTLFIVNNSNLESMMNIIISNNKCYIQAISGFSDDMINLLKKICKKSDISIIEIFSTYTIEKIYLLSQGFIQSRDKYLQFEINLPQIMSEIMYKDDDIAILRPNLKKGVLIFTRYTPSSNTEPLCKIGLKTGAQLKKEGIDFGRSVYHPYIFFRAPFYNNLIDYNTIKSEIKSLYGDIELKDLVFIRVDPDNTYVYSSEILTIPEYWGKYEEVIQRSRKTLSEYLHIIQDNYKLETNIPSDKKILYNLFTSQAELYPKEWTLPKKTFNEYPINKHSEVLVRIPHLTPDYFAYCY
jgi:hypothetical protein